MVVNEMSDFEKVCKFIDSNKNAIVIFNTKIHGDLYAKVCDKYDAQHLRDYIFQNTGDATALRFLQGKSDGWSSSPYSTYDFVDGCVSFNWARYQLLDINKRNCAKVV